MKTLKTITLSLFALLIVTGITYATSTLIPQGIPGDNTHYTLNDIYNKILNFSYTPDEPSGTITVPGTVTESFYSLTEIYNLLANQPDLTAENIAQGATILGVEGTLSTEPAELEWSAQAPTVLNWDDAGLYCTDLEEGGHTDWRLPTISELLAGISDDWIINGGADPRFAHYTVYWSGTELDSDSAWLASWDDVVLYFNADRSVGNRVLCVR